MKLKNILTSLLLAVATFASASSALQTETVVTFDNIRPANIAISNKGRMFVTGHPIVGSTKKVVEISAVGSKNIYPNVKYSDSSVNDSIIKATIGIRVDSKDNLWVLDMGAKQFVLWDLKTNKLNKIIKIPSEVLTSTSFLQDFVLDEKRGRAIIADMTQADLKSTPTPAFVVVDINTGKATRVAESHSSMMPDFEGGFALNPIAIDPSFEWVYFGALNGKKVYRVKASKFDDVKTVAKNIEFYAPKSFSDGIKVDENQNVYITDIENQAIGVSNKNGYKIIARLPKGQSWPDGLEIKNEYVYAVVNQLNRIPALNNGKDDTKGSFLIVKTPLVK
ncbi:L-dopachrome tautomerase-related protein [Arcobacter sp. CECT 8989]|uniref:L-dopachrome tautomerase-related protein n=1 Tax=Arcobacter sp. CECT 8989 TaxID=2044509 RepID=UPI0013E986A2|nr:L-dopachrome tautomerase-related protein [Arcobacter sp. CECT 8989]